MERLLKHTQASLLRFISDMAEELLLETGEEFHPINLDAESDENDLPSGHLIGLEDFSYSDARRPVALASGQIVIATQSDTNNMLLIEALSFLVDKMKAENAIILYDVVKEVEAGEMVFVGPRRVPPKINAQTKTFQAILFQVGVQPEI